MRSVPRAARASSRDNEELADRTIIVLCVIFLELETPQCIVKTLINNTDFMLPHYIMSVRTASSYFLPLPSGRAMDTSSRKLHKILLKTILGG